MNSSTGTITTSESTFLDSFPLPDVPNRSHSFLIINMPSASNGDRLPAWVRDELRRVISLKCFDTLFKRDGMTVKEQRVMMENLYHGNANKGILAHSNLFITGQPPYTEIFDRHVETVVNQSADGNENPSSLHLKEKFTRIDDKRFIVGRHITAEVLTNANHKSTQVLRGRTIHNYARSTLTTVRKACSFVQPLLKEDGTPVESGKTVDDIIEEMLENMYQMLKGKNKFE